MEIFKLSLSKMLYLTPLTILKLNHVMENLISAATVANKIPWMEQLDRHIRNHTEEKPFHCRFCDCSFSTLHYKLEYEIQ